MCIRDREQKIKQLPYVSETGRKNRAGFLVKDDRKLCDCIFLDDYAYNNMISPSLSDIVGAYPQNAFEIMISVDTLAEIGITEPQVGICLLYTSDAADDLLCVDLGGRRIIKKKIQ